MLPEVDRVLVYISRGNRAWNGIIITDDYFYFSLRTYNFLKHILVWLKLLKDASDVNDKTPKNLKCFKFPI